MKMLDEREIIGIFQARIAGRKGFVPEDVEFFRIGGAGMAFNIDTLVEDTDIPPGFTPRGISRKSIVACASDFAAKGVRPKYGFVSVTLPGRPSKKYVGGLADGIAAASAEHKIRILGGDTNEGEELSLSVCMVGGADRIVRRGGAQNGDLVFATGPFGYAAAGLRIILGGARSSGRFGARARNSVYNPVCRLDFGVAIKSLMSSSMDSSDGLSATLNEMARQSGRQFAIHTIPEAGGIQEFATFNGTEPSGMVLDGGEEYEFVFTAPERHKKRILGAARRLGVPIIEIGRVVPGDGVEFGSDGDSFCIRDGGYRHFRGR